MGFRRCVRVGKAERSSLPERSLTCSGFPRLSSAALGTPFLRREEPVIERRLCSVVLQAMTTGFETMKLMTDKPMEIHENTIADIQALQYSS